MQQELTDAELVARCRQGNDACWHALVTRYSRYVYAISVQAFRLPEPDADDVFQEVFARAYEHLDKLRDDSALRPWLARAAGRRGARARGRRRHHREARRGAVDPGSDARAAGPLR